MRAVDKTECEVLAVEFRAGVEKMKPKMTP